MIYLQGRHRQFQYFHPEVLSDSQGRRHRSYQYFQEDMVFQFCLDVGSVCIVLANHGLLLAQIRSYRILYVLSNIAQRKRCIILSSIQKKLLLEFKGCWDCFGNLLASKCRCYVKIALCYLLTAVFMNIPRNKHVESLWNQVIDPKHHKFNKLTQFGPGTGPSGDTKHSSSITGAALGEGISDSQGSEAPAQYLCEAEVKYGLFSMLAGLFTCLTNVFQAGRLGSE